jgi:CheY-like chemotaxis protein
VKVLLIEDEADVRAVIERMLRDAGAQVVPAANAAQGLDLLTTERPHVILSDIAMPGTDGYDLLRQVRALPATEGGQTPAAALTAYTRPENRRQALQAGYQLHLAKPVHPDTLIRAVADLASL